MFIYEFVDSVIDIRLYFLPVDNKTSWW